MCWRHYTWYIECRLRLCEPKIQDNYVCGPAEVHGVTETNMEDCPVRYLEGHSEMKGKCPVCRVKDLPQDRKERLREYERRNERQK